MLPSMDRLAEEWYRKWDPEFDDDEDEDLGDCDEFDIAREDALIFDEGAGK